MVSPLIRSLAVLAAASVVTAEVYNTTTSCQQANVRKAWNTLNDTEKQAYIDADLCLMNLPAIYGFEGAQNRWDELQYIHIYFTNVVHDVGGFLPWHRYYMYLHELWQKTECGYNGTQPYWHEALDAGNVTGSTIFDPVTGFGGNGTGTDGCIDDGPFANMTLHLGPVYEVTDHCLSRDFDETAMAWANVTNIEACMEYENYTDAYPCFSSKPHTAGHAGVGGVLLDITCSPGDPIFFLHHTNLDRIWWNWQKLDFPARLTDMGGQNVPDASYIEDQGLYNVTSAWLDYDGDGGLNVTTLNHTLSMLNVIANKTVGDVMDITNSSGLLCYMYDDDIVEETKGETWRDSKF